MSDKENAMSELHVDVLNQILGFLTFRDSYRFGAVCKKWREAQQNRYKKPTQLPWLILPTDPPIFSHSDGAYIRPLLNNLIYKSFRKSFITSHQGWLLKIDDKAYKDGDYKLIIFNPISKTEIKLPQCEAFCCVSSACLIASNNGQSFMVALLVSHSIKFFKTGDKAWTTCDFDGKCLCSYQIVFSNNRLLGYGQKKLVTFDLCNNRVYSLPMINEDTVTRPMSHTSINDIAFQTKNETYLVDSMGDTLLVCVSILDLNMNQYMTLSELTRFEVFKADMNEMSWVKVTNSLTDRALFVGKNCCFSTSVEEVGGQRAGIYYTHFDDETKICHSMYFDVKSGEVQWLSIIDGRYDYCPMWFQPQS